jgi:hypothetical protein
VIEPGDPVCAAGGTAWTCGEQSSVVCNGIQGLPGPLFHIEYIGTVSDAFFIASNNPLVEEWCGSPGNLTFNLVVTQDLRGNRLQPLFRQGSLNGAPVPVMDLTRSLVVYFCVNKQWGSIGQFLGQTGPAPNVTVDDQGCLHVIGNGEGILCPTTGLQGTQGLQGVQGLQGPEGPAGPV